MKKLALVFIGVFVWLNLNAQKIQELGKVDWLRDYDQAIYLSEKTNKAILILFQEVPGCATCKNYGEKVLSNPMLVDVIEHYFVPLVIYNNKEGKDKKILERYNEPSWNNPVVRIVDKEGENIIERINGNYTSAGLLDGIVQSFTERGIVIPQNIRLLEEILNTKATEESIYSMYCFWSGEKVYGKVRGVYQTTAGWQNGREVVKVEYDPKLISEKELTKIGKRSNCADQLITGGAEFRKDSDPKYYLKNSKYRQLAMHPLQAARVNSLLGEGVEDISEWLFPSQQLAMEKISTRVLYDENFEEAWQKMIAVNKNR